MILRPRVALAILLALAILPATAGVAFLVGLRINLTPSYPLGLWRVAPLGRDVVVGDRIFICPPQTSAFELARDRGYLGHGLCPGWFSPLIKTVVAVAGQHVVIHRSLVVDGVQLDHSSVRPVDSQGRALASATSSTVQPGELFLFSDFAGSYDSRYFGPIPAAGVIGLAQPLLIFGP